MGSGRVNVAVADAGPLIHLNEIGCFSLLRIFETLHIPDAVWSETVGQARVSQADVLGLSNVQQHSLPQEDVAQFIQKNSLEDLHTGERECLYLCQQVGVPILLTDDLVVREAAKRLKYYSPAPAGRQSGRPLADNCRPFCTSGGGLSSAASTR